MVKILKNYIQSMVVVERYHQLPLSLTNFFILKLLVFNDAFIVAASDNHSSGGTGTVAYSNTWAVKIYPQNDSDQQQNEGIAKKLIEGYGFQYLGVILKNVYHIRHRRIAKRSYKREAFHHRRLSQHPSVRWMVQQILRRRIKRDVLTTRSRRQQPYSNFNDPKWAVMWHLNRDLGFGYHWLMNVQAAWKNGYTGRGVVVSILDDGLEWRHRDLNQNYDSRASFDFISQDKNPQPINVKHNHGTRCAGQVAAVANNGICGLGIAYHAKIGGIRMWSDDITDAIEGNSFSYKPNHIDIYSASWGPDDDGKTVDGPHSLTREALKIGAREGRNGKGSIFVFASGNGGRKGDSCSFDGYTNSIYTISVSSTTEDGKVPNYSEQCPGILATTYSSGGGRDLVAPDLNNSCTESFTGTSASASLAAGICALVLEANPALTWRDMQHIIVRTARRSNLVAGTVWESNGVGRNVSHNYGYGLMNAAAMVELARIWPTVSPQHECSTEWTSTSDEVGEGESNIIVHDKEKSFTVQSHACQGNSEKYIQKLEHVEAKISLELTGLQRGGVEIFLQSPMGTTSQLAFPRRNDRDTKGFDNWSFMTVHSWGEDPRGKWTLTIKIAGMPVIIPPQSQGKLTKWSLVQYGTSTEGVDAEESTKSDLTRRTTRSFAYVTRSFRHMTTLPIIFLLIYLRSD